MPITKDLAWLVAILLFGGAVAGVVGCVVQQTAVAIGGVSSVALGAFLYSFVFGD